MDPNSPPHVIFGVADVVDTQNDVQNDNHPIQDNAHIPGLVPFVFQTSDSQAPPQEHNDVHMNGDDDDDDMPALQEVSDESDSEADSDSDRDANEVEMQAVDPDDEDDHVPAVNNTPDATLASNLQNNIYVSPYESTRRPNNNRRARVEDDEDEERDRRHPSQRVSSANNNAASATPSRQASAHLSQNQSQTRPVDGAPVPSAQAQRQNPHIQHHIFHATLNLPRRNGEGSNNSPFRFFQHLMPNHNDTAPATQNNNNPHPHSDNNNAALEVPQPPPQQQNGNNNGRPPQLFEGVAVSFEIGPGFHIPPGQGGPPQAAQAGEQTQGSGQPPPQNQLPRPGTVADLMARFGVLGQTLNVLGDFDGPGMGIPVNINFGNLGLGLGMQQEKEDPERARKLVDGLEEVPVGLVRRLERVGGTGGGMGEDISNGGDAGCAICWDKLLDGDGDGFGKAEKAPSEQEQEAGAASSEPKTEQPKIVSLPCAHVFHADCLIPWFSRPRHTTCPTCRFNIDPENLTYVSAHRRQREQEQAEAARRTEDSVGVEPGEPATNINNDNNPDTHPPDFLSPAEAEMQENQFHEMLNRMTARNTVPTDPPVAARTTPPAGPAHVVPATTPATTPAPLATTIQTPHGPVSVIQVPIPIMIPVQVPAGPAIGAQGGVAVNQNEPASTTNPAVDGLALPQPEGQAQLQAGPGAEFARLLSRIIRQDPQQPVPFNALFPAPLFHLGGQQQTNQQPPLQAAPPSGNATTALTAEAVQGRNLPPRVVSDPATAVTPEPGTLDAGQPAPSLNNNSTNQPTMDVPLNQLPPNIHAAEVMRFTFDMIFNRPLPTPAGVNPPPPSTQGPAAPQDGQADRETTAEDFMMMLEEGNPVIDQDVPRMRNLDEVLELLAADEREERAELEANRNNTGGVATLDAESQARPAEVAAPPPDPSQQRPSQFLPPLIPGFNLGNGIHFASGSGRTVSEAFSQLFAGMRTTQPRAQQAPAAQPHPEAQPGQEPPQGGDAQQQVPPPAMESLPMPDMRMFPNLAAIFGGGFQDRQEQPKRPWTLPPAPGPTLRQRIERREREAGLRCYDVSCGIGPSDDDPLNTEIGASTSEVKQLSIKSKEDRSELCTHTFHSACLVSAERVSLRGGDATVEDGQVEVSCPVCRGVGCVSNQEWEEGVVALA